jgi:hypothetical protein
MPRLRRGRDILTGLRHAAPRRMTHLYPGTPFSLPAIRLDSLMALSALIRLAFLLERMARAWSRVAGKCNYSNPLRAADGHAFPLLYAPSPCSVSDIPLRMRRAAPFHLEPLG